MPERRRATAPAPGAKAGSRAAPPKLQTFAAAMGEPASEGAPEDQVTRSFYLRKSTITRLQAVFAGIKHAEYDTAIEGEVPGSLSALADEALNAAARYYENLLNGGERFREVTRLSPGPSAAGAQRGAARRAEARRSRDAAPTAN